MSYHTDAAIKEVVSDLAELKDIDEKAARSLLVSGGYKIYTTQKYRNSKENGKRICKKMSIYIMQEQQENKKKTKNIHNLEW